MSLLIKLAQRGFMDDMEDDGAWSQINVRALASETSPLVRRDALYFVIEQLEAWDDDEHEARQGDQRWSKDKNVSLVQSEETVVVKKLDSLASW
jgi:cohesin complex subunit SA-1/2